MFFARFVFAFALCPRAILLINERSCLNFEPLNPFWKDISLSNLKCNLFLTLPGPWPPLVAQFYRITWRVGSYFNKLNITSFNWWTKYSPVLNWRLKLKGQNVRKTPTALTDDFKWKLVIKLNNKVNCWVWVNLPKIECKFGPWQKRDKFSRW